MQNQIRVATSQHRIPKTDVRFEDAISRQGDVEIVKNLPEGRVTTTMNPDKIDVHLTKHYTTQRITQERVRATVGIPNLFGEKLLYFGETPSTVAYEKVGDAVIDEVSLIQTKQSEVNFALAHSFSDERKSERIAEAHEFPHVVRRVRPREDRQ